MFKTLIALTFMFNSYALMASSVAAKKSEVELKLALTKNGFDRLKTLLIKKFDAETSNRTDYYFDYFENAHYVLRDLEQPIKLRMMWDGESLKWQNQKVLKTGSRSIFSIKTTEASELELNYDDAFFKSLDLYFQKLILKDIYAMTIATGIQNSLVKKGIVLESDKRYFVTHFNSKNRVKIKLKIDSDQFSIQVGETVNRGVSSYELEAEVKKGNDINKSVDRLNKWLQSEGLDATYIDISVPVDPTEWSQNLLNEFFVFSIHNI